MIRKAVVHAVVLSFMLSMFFFFARGDSLAMSVTPGVYHVYGRVLNQQEKPVENCNVMLIKSKSREEEKETTGENQQVENADKQSPAATEQQVERENKTLEPDEIVSQEIVAITRANGEFSFVFEPLEGDNFWVYFVTDGYRTRTIQMNKLMRSRFFRFRKPNKSPLRIEVVLEKN